LIVDHAEGGVRSLEIDYQKINAAPLGSSANEFFSLVEERRTMWIPATND
jgi:hypothetical protein